MYIKYRYRNLPGEKMPLIKNMDAIRKPKNVRCQTRMENVNFVFNIRVRKIISFLRRETFINNKAARLLPAL